MTLQEAYDFLNFWINKYTGSWYTMAELDAVVDRGQMALFNDLAPRYATSEIIQDALAPFVAEYNFNSTNTVSGYIVIPSNSNYMQLLDIMVSYQVSNRTLYAGVPIINKDERASRLNSEIEPVTATSPVAELTAPRFIRLWPQTGVTGFVSYLRRPAKPYFAYNLISNRVINYIPEDSTQLEWSEQWQNLVLIKALASVGVNLSDAELSQYSAVTQQQNFGGKI